MKVILRNGKEGVVRFDDKLQSALVDSEGRSYLIAFIRDNKVRVKNDILLTPGDLSSVRLQMTKYIKHVDVKAKRRK